MHPEKIEVDPIQNGRPSDIIYFIYAWYLEYLK